MPVIYDYTPVITAPKDMCFNATSIKTIILMSDAQNACYLFFGIGLVLGLVLMYYYMLEQLKEDDDEKFKFNNKLK